MTGEDLSQYQDLLGRRKRSIIEQDPIILRDGELFPLLDLISKVDERIEVEKNNSISLEEESIIKPTEVTHFNL